MIVELLVIEVLADVEIVVMGVIVNVLAVSYSTDVPSEVDVDWSKNELMVGVLPRIGIEVLPDVSEKTFAVDMAALGFTLSTRLEEVCCC